MARYRAQMLLAASLPSPLLAAAEMHRIQRNAEAYARRNGTRRSRGGLMRGFFSKRIR